MAVILCMKVTVVRTICPCFFKDIWHCRSNDRVKNFIGNNMFKWSVGNGQLVNFWKDLWYGNCTLRISFRILYNLAIRKDINVADMVSS